MHKYGIKFNSYLKENMAKFNLNIINFLFFLNLEEKIIEIVKRYKIFHIFTDMSSCQSLLKNIAESNMIKIFHYYLGVLK
jgi:hypothetical protein